MVRRGLYGPSTMGEIITMCMNAWPRLTRKGTPSCPQVRLENNASASTETTIQTVNTFYAVFFYFFVPGPTEKKYNGGDVFKFMHGELLRLRPRLLGDLFALFLFIFARGDIYSHSFFLLLLFVRLGGCGAGTCAVNYLRGAHL